MNDERSALPGLWGRLSRRAKIVVVLDLFVLIVIVAVGAMLFICSEPSSHTQSKAVQPTSTAPTRAIPSLESAEGLAWIVAACGSPLLIKDLPVPPLPRANESGICLAQLGSVPIAIGVYDDDALLRSDIADANKVSRYATRTGNNNENWLFLLEGHDAGPLESLERYGFSLH